MNDSFEACAECPNALVCESCAVCYHKIETEAWEERQAYIAKGVCADCGACSLKDAETKCQPGRDHCDEWTCAGEPLWHETTEKP